MEKGYSPQEILKVAVDVEEKGKKIFEIFEEKAGDSRLKAVWKYLKEQEILHYETFKSMLDNIGDYVVDDYSTGEYDAYMKAIASEYIFTPELIDAKSREPFDSDLDAIDFGIFIEKQSIMTYNALREYIQGDKQNVLDKIIAEEKKHFVRLIELRDMVKTDLE
jgi:rubrerythrin